MQETREAYESTGRVELARHYKIKSFWKWFGRVVYVLILVTVATTWALMVMNQR